MPIICFEGPSAVGKSTTAAAFAALRGAHVIPEVNELFDRPADASSTWYLGRQVDRWKRAVKDAQHGKLVILDGDPFQPLWYNWAYQFDGWEDIDSLEAFYRPIIARGDLAFPDRYVLFGARVEALRKRKAGDSTRSRRRFEKHLELIEPQRRYFKSMKDFVPELVSFLDAKSVKKSVQTISVMVSDLGGQPVEPLDLFDYLLHWLKSHTT